MALGKTLSPGRVELSVSATKILEALKLPRPDRVNVLVEAFDMKGPSLPSAILLVLGALGEESRPALPRIVVYLRSENVVERLHALAALGWIGGAALDEAPAVEKLLSDPEELVRCNAILALVDVGDPKARAAIQSLTEDKSRTVRNAAKDALKKLGTS